MSCYFFFFLFFALFNVHSNKLTKGTQLLFYADVPYNIGDDAWDQFPLSELEKLLEALRDLLGSSESRPQTFMGVLHLSKIQASHFESVCKNYGKYQMC